MDAKSRGAVEVGFDLALNHRDGGVQVHLTVEVRLGRDESVTELDQVGKWLGARTTFLDLGRDAGPVLLLLAQTGVDVEDALRVVPERSPALSPDAG